MPVQYDKLPFFTIYNHLSDHTKNIHYEKMLNTFDSHQVSLFREFHIGHFQLSGVNHFMPEFLISSETKKMLNYPQAFLIMEANHNYYTDRSHLDSFEIRFTLSGEGSLTYRNRKYQLKAGEGYWIDCREPHYYQTEGDSWTSTIFHLNGSLARTIFAQYASDGNVKFTSESCPNFEMLQFQILKATQKVMPYYEYHLSCLIDILLTELLSSKALHDKQPVSNSSMQDLIYYLQEHYMDDITIEDLMHRFGFSRTNLCREFKNYTGFTIKKYILELRMNQAKRLLHSSEKCVEEIAAQVGFHDTAHFVQMFKKATHSTPLQYRKML